MTRLFTALEIPDDTAMQLGFMQAGLENARWVEREALHITLRFIGEVDGAHQAAIHEALAQINARPFSITLAGIGSFGNRRPRAVWAGVKENNGLKFLQQVIERACQRAGLEPEQRKFTPHVTLARLKDVKRARVETYMASHNLYRIEPFDVTRFVMFSSKPSHGGGPYVADQTYPLTEDIS
jgi:RNA 2',3'-cyclic 3'-phosphodiesterase